MDSSCIMFPFFFSMPTRPAYCGVVKTTFVLCVLHHSSHFLINVPGWDDLLPPPDGGSVPILRFVNRMAAMRISLCTCVACSIHTVNLMSMDPQITPLTRFTYALHV
eukprot:2156698-Amphidinium_carterae.3